MKASQSAGISILIYLNIQDDLPGYHASNAFGSGPDMMSFMS